MVSIFQAIYVDYLVCIEALIGSCSVKKVFLEISQNPQENTCARVSFFFLKKEENVAQVFSCEFCEISTKTFFHRTPLVAASVFIVKVTAQTKVCCSFSFNTA